MSDQPPNSFTFIDFLAVWGAVVATFALGWNIIRDWRDKPKLKVSASLGTMLGGSLTMECLSVSVTNVGRRPLTVDELYGDLDSRQRMFLRTLANIGSQLPKKLDEGECMKLITEIDPDVLTHLTQMITLCVEDSSGRKWPVPPKQIDSIKSLAAEWKRKRQADND